MSSKISFVLTVLFKLKRIYPTVAKTIGKMGFRETNLQNSETEKSNKIPNNNKKLYGEYSVAATNSSTYTAPDKALVMVVVML